MQFCRSCWCLILLVYTLTTNPKHENTIRHWLTCTPKTQEAFWRTPSSLSQNSSPDTIRREKFLDNRYSLLGMKLRVMRHPSLNPSGCTWSTSFLSATTPWTTLEIFSYCLNVFFSRYSSLSTVINARHFATSTKITNSAWSLVMWQKCDILNHLKS